MIYFSVIHLDKDLTNEILMNENLKIKNKFENYLFHKTIQWLKSPLWLLFSVLP